jgi:hypothetical protein
MPMFCLQEQVVVVHSAVSYHSRLVLSLLNKYLLLKNQVQSSVIYGLFLVSPLHVSVFFLPVCNCRRHEYQDWQLYIVLKHGQ